MKPFEYHQPSVFVVRSPFQALCAVSAIHNMEISDYKFIVILSNFRRDDQLLNFVKSQNINYVVYETKRFAYWFQLIKSLIKRKKGYSRLFVGDFRAYIQYWIGLQWVKDGADVVILDDGNITISLLQGSLGVWRNKIQVLCMGIISTIRRIDPLKNVYTIYEGIDNPQFNISINKIEKIQNKENGKRSKVYFIGTKKKQFCEYYGWNNDLFFISAIDGILNCIKNKYPTEEVVYIPHGDDVGEYLEELCKKNNIIIYRPSMMVELFLLDNGYPLAVYGFMSSALFNIKKMFTNSEVYNIVFKSIMNEQAKLECGIISEYYQKNNIKQLIYEEVFKENSRIL